MTAAERMKRIIEEIPKEERDTSAFWKDMIEAAVGVMDANDLQDKKLMDAFHFMYLGCVLIEETRDIFEPEVVHGLFQEHINAWNGISDVIKIKIIPKTKQQNL